MDQVRSDAMRLAAVGSALIAVGWVFIIYALVAGVLWWIDLASRESFNFLEALAISSSVIGVPLFTATVVLGAGYTMRLFALYVATKSA